MLVMKFGGASVRHAEAIRNVAKILSHYLDKPCLIVVSAMDKTTNHLESLAYLARDNKKNAALEQFRKIRRFHVEVIHDLFESSLANKVLAKVRMYFEEIEQIVSGILLLQEFSSQTYDRIVSYGEILSTTLLEAYLDSVDFDCGWLDARKIIKTNANFREAGVIWSLTRVNINEVVLPLMKEGRMLITQGFIGSTTEGKTTTLGREGSDYTGSIFAHCLEAESLTVWKDVPGILNGDPRIRKNTVKIDQLSYEEAVEMTFYGASVIHPKTIKPIYNKNIPLHVKCFDDVDADGTIISEMADQHGITAFIVRQNQIFFRIRPKDFSFMEERLMQRVFNSIYKSGIKVNLVQNSAISLMICANDKSGNAKAFEALLLDEFDVEVRKNLSLNTIINFAVKDLKETVNAVMVQQQGNKLFIVK